MRYSVKWPMCPVCFTLDFIEEEKVDETHVFCKCENRHTWAEPITDDEDEENEEINT